jgi:hypothetical protein
VFIALDYIATRPAAHGAKAKYYQLCQKYSLRFEAFTAVTMKNAVF